jgi:predicted DNA-binding transcriptional regulator YafY
MTSKLARFTDLLVALLRRRYPASFQELAQDVAAYSDPGQAEDARMRMFERDKDELRAFGVPIETVRGPDGEVAGYRMPSRAFYLPYLYLTAAEGRPRREPQRVSAYGYQGLPALTFEPDELEIAAAATRRAGELGDPMLQADAESALRKLSHDLPLDTAVPDDPHMLRRDRIDPRSFELLNDALIRRKTVTFSYHSIGRDDHSARKVEPYGLFLLGGHWYLAANDIEREGIRNFRLSRMSDLRVNTARPQTRDFSVPAEFSLRGHARSRHAWELGSDDAMDAEVEFDITGGAVAAAAELGAPGDGDERRRRFSVRRSDSFVRWLLSFGGAAAPRAPKELVDEYRAQLRETLEVYSR